MGALRDRLWQLLQERVGGVTMNGAESPRLPGNLNVGFAGVDGESLLVGLTDVAASSGAACTSAEPSHVLVALGLDKPGALASLRFGLGRETTGEEIDRAAAHVATWWRTSGDRLPRRGWPRPARADRRVPMYSAAVLERVRNPRRVGEFPEGREDVGTGQSGTLDEGTTARIQVRAEAGRIVEARFKVFGCSAAIAAAGLVAEWLEGVDGREGRRHHPGTRSWRP
jgi:hypothetical protein